jgi:hypothetical protein
MNETQYQQLHGRFAVVHDRLQYTAGRIFDIVQRHLALSAVLDVGCGTGDFLFQANKRGIANGGGQAPAHRPRTAVRPCAHVRPRDLAGGG